MYYALGETLGKHIFSMLVRTKRYIADAANPVFTATEYLFITVEDVSRKQKSVSIRIFKRSRRVQWPRSSHYGGGGVFILFRG